MSLASCAAAQVRVQARVDEAARSSAPAGIRHETKDKLPRTSNASDAGSVTSSSKSIRPTPYSRPPPQSRRTASRGHSLPPTSKGRVGAPSIGDVLNEALQKAVLQPQKPRGKGGPARASTVAGRAASLHGPPSSLGRLQLDESAAAADSPMSTTGSDPTTAPHESGVRLPATRGTAAPAYGDSSDEEGAHRPPSPERPPPAPPAPPAPPLQPPQMLLALELSSLELNAALPSIPVAAARTTRVSNEDRRALQQAHQEEQAAAEEVRAQMEVRITELLLNPCTSIFDILMVECVLQPGMPHDAGALRAAYLKLLKAARDVRSVPRQKGVANMATLRDVFMASLPLREKAALTIATRKVLYAESQCGHGNLGAVEARPDETLMALITRTHTQLLPRIGRPPNGVQGGALKIRPSRSGGQVTNDWREREHAPTISNPSSEPNLSLSSPSSV